MGLRQRGSVIGNYATASSNSASGIWTGKEAYTLQKKGTWQIPPTFSLSSSAGTVNEGASVNFTLTTTGISNGTVIPYTLSGANVTTSDSANNILTGNFVISNGSGIVSFNANADVTLEGTETIQMTAAGKTANVTINDTSFPSDAQFPYTVLLLNGDGTNNAQNNTFLDSSTNNFTLTRNGNATQGSFSPYANNWSWYFDGTGDYLVSSGRADIATGEFTIEAWVYPTAYNTAQIIIGNSNWNIGQNSGYQIYIKSTGVVGLGASAGVFNTYPEVYASTNAVLLNKWSHIAITRDASNVIRSFINGVLDPTTASYSTSLNLQTSQNPTTIISGALYDGGLANTFTGYISNIRVVNGSGSCLYTTTFTPSTTPLTAISNTKILCCKSNRFIDTGPGGYTFTKYGDVSVTKFSPHTVSSAYTPSTLGGSVYFDGTGDNFVINNGLHLGTSDFTIELWVNNSIDYTSVGLTFINSESSGSGLTWSIGYQTYNGRNGFTFAYGTYGSNTVAKYVDSEWGKKNAWTHYAVQRRAGVIEIYVNGVSKALTTNNQNASFTDSTNFTSNYTSRTIGDTYNGHFSDFRIVKGSAVYTGNFTPPIAPVSTSGSTSTASYSNTANVNLTFPSSNTFLLNNFTNAGIYDSTMISDVETVGDSKISSTQSKFGGTAIFFDGTGDYISLKNPQYNYTFLKSEWTIETWIYPTSTSTTQTIFMQYGNSVDVIKLYFNGSTGAVSYQLRGTNQSLISADSAGSLITLNTWSHIAMVRDSTTTIKIFVNGTLALTATIASTTTFNEGGSSLYAEAPVIGAKLNATTDYYVGYMDDFRITKGYARYTTNFTPPTLAHGDK